MNHPVRIGLKLSQDAPIDAFRRVWSIADQAGFDHLWAFDHLASIGPIGPDRPVFEGWSLLSAMAVAATRPRLGLMVTGVTYRNPALLAKLAVSVDHLSNGRLEFGIGAAWATNEHTMYGIEGLEHRVGRLSEGLKVLKLLWTQERSDFDGRYYQLKDAIANPKPVQKPHPPIWIGASGPTTMKLVARHADVWNAAGEAGRSIEAAVAASRHLDQLCAEMGRDPSEIRRSAQLRLDPSEPSRHMDEMIRYREAGFTELVTYCGGDDPVRSAEVAAETVLPQLRSRQPA